MAGDGAGTDGVMRRALLLEKPELCLLFLLMLVMAQGEEIHFSHWDVWILELLTLPLMKSFPFVTVACIVFLRLPLLATNTLSMCSKERNALLLLCVGHAFNNCFPFSNKAWIWKQEMFWRSSCHSIAWSWLLWRKLCGQLCSICLPDLLVLPAVKPSQ